LVPGVAVRQGNWKLIQRFEPTDEYPDGFELFDLKEDLGERRNLASSMPEKVKQLTRLIDAFVTQTGAAVPKPNPRFNIRAANARPLLGWVPKGCKANIVEGSLAISPNGKSPFIAMTGLRVPGPVKLTLHVKSDFLGKCRVQWRTVDQETFVPGQNVEFQLNGSADWQEVTIELPVKGTLLHFRLGVPATNKTCEIAKITLRSASSPRVHTWDFAAAN
jgi:hypothetical protein